MSELFPKFANAVGLPKRALILFGSFLLLFVTTFLYFIHHYTPKKRIDYQDTQITNQVEAINLISAVQKQPPIQRRVVTNQNQSEEPNHQFLQAAADSAISAYQHQLSSTLTQPLFNQAVSTQNLPLSLPEKNNAYQQQNQQAEKIQFLKSTSESKTTEIQSRTRMPSTRYALKAGTLIAATLQTGINSDLPGTILAKVSRNVYDTVSGNYLLIPQGTTLIGQYDSTVAYGQQRVLIAWQRLIFPNGASQQLLGQQGVDSAGQSGLRDQVNNHYFKIFGSALMFSAFGAAAQLSQPVTSGDSLSAQQMAFGAISQQLSQTGAQLVAKNMNIQPSLNIRPGTNFNVILAKDLTLSSAYRP